MPVRTDSDDMLKTPGEGFRTAGRGSTQSDMRAHNERLILSLLRQNGPMARAAIARASGLSAQTVSVIMRGLEEDGLLARGAPVRGKVGQPSIPMRLARSGAFFFGLKVGRRSVDLILIDFVGEVLGRVHKTHRFPMPDDILRFALDSVDSLRARMPPGQAARVAGMGVAMPFRLWEWATSIGAPADRMEEWKSRDIQAELAEELDFPIFLRNDASAACGAELVFGTGERPNDFLHFFVGYFVGGGIVLNNRLHTGRSGNAAALGSMPVPTASGGVRQLVDVASLSVLESLARQRNHPTATLWDPPEGWSLDPGLLADWLGEASAALAYAIASASSVLDFEVAMIDGWLPARVRSELVRRTGEALSDLSLSGIEKPSIRAGTIGPDARSLGAASLPLSQRYMADLSAVASAG